MTVEHHDLIHELPDFRDKIHELKTTSRHFRRLFDEYHVLTTDIEKIENEVIPMTTAAEQGKKRLRVHLKDELYALLTAGTPKKLKQQPAVDTHIQTLIDRAELLERRLEKIKLDVTAAYSYDANEQAQERENDEVIDQIGNATREELSLVYLALDRNKQGKYGNCQSCQKPIEDNRLDAVPEAELCAGCTA